MSLESKHTSLLKKNDKLIKQLVEREAKLKDLERDFEEEEKTAEKIRAEYYSEKEGNITLQEQIGTRISLVESKTLTQKQRELAVEVEGLGNDLHLYKQLYENLSTKSRYEEMRVAKVESERDKYYHIVKEFQGLSDSNAELGKKVY